MDLVFLVFAHVPYLRRAGRDSTGEDLLHQLIAESLLPLIETLEALHSARRMPRIGLALSPILLEQLADPVVQKHFVLRMEQMLRHVEQDLGHWEHENVSHQAYLAHFYLEWCRNTLRSFEERYSRSLVGALHDLCGAGVIEPLAGAATYGYLPLLGRSESQWAQIELGVLSVTQHLGRPQGIWMPHCGVWPGLPSLITAADLRYIVADPQTLELEQPSPVTVAPYDPVWLEPRRLAALPLHTETSMYIWSQELGYSGDLFYRDQRRDAQSGLAYWARGAAGAAPYDPYHAFRRAQEHADHFLKLLKQESRQHSGPLVVPLDLELLGIDWFEGPAWMRAVLLQCADQPGIRLATPSEALRAARPEASAYLRSGSWGVAGDHSAWQGGAADAYWRELHNAEAQLVQAATQPAAPGSLYERLLNQAARELLLAQSSDWPLLLRAGQEELEVTSRWRIHLRRCLLLCSLAARPVLDEDTLAALDEIEEQDNPFPALNYRIFTMSDER